jgi:hypothetical protein
MKFLGYIAAIVQKISTEAKAQVNDTVCALAHRKINRIMPTPGLTNFRSVECADAVRTWVIMKGKKHLLINGPSENCEGEPVVLKPAGPLIINVISKQTHRSRMLVNGIVAVLR